MGPRARLQTTIHVRLYSPQILLQLHDVLGALPMPFHEPLEQIVGARPAVVVRVHRVAGALGQGHSALLVGRHCHVRLVARRLGAENRARGFSLSAFSTRCRPAANSL